jgi:hypothetical protein
MRRKETASFFIDIPHLLDQLAEAASAKLQKR